MHILDFRSLVKPLISGREKSFKAFLYNQIKEYLCIAPVSYEASFDFKSLKIDFDPTEEELHQLIKNFQKTSGSTIKAISFYYLFHNKEEFFLSARNIDHFIFDEPITFGEKFPPPEFPILPSHSYFTNSNSTNLSRPVLGGETIEVEDRNTFYQDNHANVFGIESFQYSRKQDDFIGRNTLLNSLEENFLDFNSEFTSETAFRWTLIHGEAGIGKSRFALELLARGKEMWGPKFDTSQWGFVQRNPEDVSASLTEDKISRWNPSGPAVLILDYAGTNKNLVSIVKCMRDRALILTVPIRLVLLERRNDSGRVADLDRVADEDRFLKDTCFELDTVSETSGIGIKLDQLTDYEILDLMKSRIRRERGKLLKEETDDWLLQRLDDIGIGERRPLFAAMVASAIAGQNDEFVQKVGFEGRTRRRERVLQYLVKRDRTKYWSMPDDEEDKWVLGMHENLLALSTFSRGLDLSILRDSSNYPNCSLPSIREFDARRFTRMSTSNFADKGQVPIGFLEPDFIGEWFVLSKLDLRNKLEVDVPLNTPEVTEFVDLAWDKGRERAAQFVRQCHQNHPDAVRSFGYLLPQPGKHREQIIPLLCDIMLDLRRSLQPPEEEKEFSFKANEIISERAEEVFLLLKNHVEGAQSLSEESKHDVSDVIECYLYIKSWMLSPTLQARKDDRLKISKSKDESSRSQSLLLTSRTLQELFKRRTSLPGMAQGIEADKEKKNEKDIFFIPDKVAQILGKGFDLEKSPDHTKVQDRRTNRSGAPIYELAGKLLSDAATFFRALGEKNDELHEQMNENASVFAQMGSLISNAPTGVIDDKTHGELAGQLLKDASDFFLALAEQNEPLKEQMEENAKVYAQLAKDVSTNPTGWMD